MGLDISIRWVRQGAKQNVPYKNWDDTISYHYDENDVEEYSGDWLQGRGEFDIIRQWVRDDRYGKYIPLVGDDYKTLITMVEKEIHDRIEETEARRKAHPEWYEDDPDKGFPWYLEDGDYGLNRLYGMILKAPLYEAKGWIMELECDW